jgi:hypothetical protein
MQAQEPAPELLVSEGVEPKDLATVLHLRAHVFSDHAVEGSLPTLIGHTAGRPQSGRDSEND